MKMHTPGPWWSDKDNGPYVMTGDGECTIAKIYGEEDGTDVSDEQRDADKALVTAAPDMLAALEAAHAKLGSIAEACNSVTDNAKYWTPEYTSSFAQQIRLESEEVQAAARAAIAKALNT
jgi:hypothetical protein